MELRNNMNLVELKEFECQFCNNIFADSKVLRQHQKKTNYCLKIQDVVLSKVEAKEKVETKEKKELSLKENTKKLECQFCNNIFGDTKMLRQHQKKTKYCLKIQEIKAKEQDEKNLIEAKVKEIEENKAKAEELALKDKAKELTCKFCSKEFKTKYLLNIHQTQAKYCLKKQEYQNYQEIISLLITCKFCDKNFSVSSYAKHALTCKKKIKSLTKENAEKDQEISILKMKAEKDQEISILKMKAEKDKEISLIYKAAAERVQTAFEEIAKQPTYQKNSTRNIQNNLMISSLTPLDLTQARVDSIIDEKYTKNDFYEGQKGAAQVVYKYIATDSDGKSQIVCTDTERGTFHHNDVNGEHVVDYKNSHLINKVHLPLKRKASKFAAEESIKNPNAFKDIVMNETSIRELETKPGLFNRTMAQLTGKNCARTLLTTNEQLDLSITEEWLLENAKFLTIEHILRGPEGYADYALSYPLKDRLIIDDDYYDSEHKVVFVKYKDINGDIIVDLNGQFLGKMIIDSLKGVKNKLLIKHNIVDFNEDAIFIEEFTKILIDNI